MGCFLAKDRGYFYEWIFHPCNNPYLGGYCTEVSKLGRMENRIDTTIIISDTSLGFISYKAKNIVDRMLPLATMYTHIVDGQMRHVPCYDKEYRFGIVYSGNADIKYLEQWLGRFALNFDEISIGAFTIEKCREVLPCT